MTAWTDLLSPPPAEPAGPLAQMFSVAGKAFADFTAGLSRPLRGIAGELLVLAGKAIGFGRRRSRLVPGLAGAGMVSWGIAGFSTWAGVIAGGVFLLAMDRQMTLRSGENNP